MYEVSEAYKTQMHARARFEHVRGTIGTATFTDANVITMSYSNRCSDTADVSFGSAYIGQLTATFIGVNVLRGDWRGLKITVEAGLVLPDESTEYVPLGEFTIASAEWGDIGVTVTANDNMIKLDKEFAGLQLTTADLYTFANYACFTCGAQFALTREECEALPNGNEQIGLYEINDIKTYRDFISWLAQLVGGFVTATRDGKITIRTFADSETVDTLTAGDRISGSVFSDYSTLYDGISVVNMTDDTLSYYSAGQGIGSAIKLGKNPFLQLGLDEVKERQRQLIAEIAHGIEYTPFTSTVLSHIAYDLGDVLTCTGGNAGNETLHCCIMQIEWMIKQTTTLRGYGADPSLASGQSKTDKNLQGILSKTDSNEIKYYRYQNAEEVELGEDIETDIATILFASKKVTAVDIWLEVKLNTENSSDPAQVPVWQEQEVIDPETGLPVTEVVQIGWWDEDHTLPIEAIVRYYYDGIIEPYSPVETWDEDGYHTIHYGYYLPSVSTDITHTFKATLELNHGSAIISTNDITMIVRGQALAADSGYDGTIKVEDKIGTYEFEALTVIDITDDVEIVMADVFNVEITDEARPADIEPLTPVSVTEEVSIILHSLAFAFITEDGEDKFITQDDQDVIVTEYD